jgi:protein arginine N-methyltransferase 3
MPDDQGDAAPARAAQERGLLPIDAKDDAPPSDCSSSSSASSSQAGDNDDDDREWDEWDDGNANANDSEDDESDRTRSLFDPPSAPPLPSPSRALQHDAEQHGFDLRRWRRSCGLDQYGVIRAVNWARRCAERGEDPRPAFRAYEEQQVAGGGDVAPPWAGDEFLVPVIPDDPLVMYDYEEEDDEEAAEAEKAGAAAATAAATATTDATASGSNATLVERLAAENAALRARLQALVEATLPDELRDECSLVGGKAAAAGASGSSSKPAAAAATLTTPNTTTAIIDAAYFDSYSHFDIHREMLSDAPRTEAYRRALELNPSLMRGARVVDVGAGTGVLSLFAARGGGGGNGAREVTGIEGSERMAGIARRVAAANGLGRDQGGPVAIVSGRVEELVVAANDPASLQLLPAPNSADVLVSEWMGYALLFESMLSSVLTARDAWLKPGGAVLPDVARVLVAGGDLRAALGCGFWDDVYGLRMSPIGDEVVDGVLLKSYGGRRQQQEAAGKQEKQEEQEEQQRPRSSPSSWPRLLVRQVAASALRTEPALVRELDLATMSHDDQDFTAEFECCCAGQTTTAAAPPPTPDKAAAAPPAAAPTTTTTTISCLVLWFDTLFTERFCRDHPVVLSTSPLAEPTHWAQAVLPLSMPVVVGGEGGESSNNKLRGRLSMARRRGRHRALDISLEYWPDGPKRASVVQMYSMGVNQDADEE